MIWLQIAVRDLYRNSRRTSWALGIVAVGAMASLAVAGYMLATFTAVRDATIFGGVGHLQIARPEEFSGYEQRVLGNGLTPADVQRIQLALSGLASVDLVLPRLAFQGIVSNGERSLIALGEGIDPRNEHRLSRHYLPIVSGIGLDAVATARRFHALVGVEMARLLGVSPGNTITLLVTAANGGLNAVDVQVAGIFSSGVPELDRMRVIVPIAAAQELLQSAKVRRIALKLDSTGQTAATRAQLLSRLPDLDIHTWYELAPLYRQLVALYSKQAMVFAVIVAITVAIAVAGTVSIGVLERRRDIGTLLSLGIPRSRVRRTFLYEGALLGLAGASVGALGAIALFALINAVSIQMPAPPGQTESYPLRVLFEPRYAACITCIMSLVGLLAAWAATRNVIRQPIVEAMST